MVTAKHDNLANHNYLKRYSWGSSVTSTGSSRLPNNSITRRSSLDASYTSTDGSLRQYGQDEQHQNQQSSFVPMQLSKFDYVPTNGDGDVSRVNTTTTSASRGPQDHQDGTTARIITWEKQGNDSLHQQHGPEALPPPPAPLSVVCEAISHAYSHGASLDKSLTDRSLVSTSKGGSMTSSAKAHIDSIIELKMLVANQQATIDTLASKLHNLELSHRQLKNSETGRNQNLESENRNLATQLNECRAREISLRNELNATSTTTTTRSAGVGEQQQAQVNNNNEDTERENRDLKRENDDLKRQFEELRNQYQQGGAGNYSRGARRGYQRVNSAGTSNTASMSCPDDSESEQRK